jgi:two-component system OmpR family response regulator
MKILVAEDDHSVCEMLRLFLNREKYSASFVHDGTAAARLIEGEEWDLFILDWMLPGRDGLSLCREIRRSSDAPVILLTARDTEPDRIAGLDGGADDYITKPFSPMELMARVRAVLRRCRPRGNEPADCLQYKDLSVDLATRELAVGNRHIRNLTPKEFNLLCLFMKYPKRVFTREQLLESVWGYDYFGEERTVDVHIQRLRNKISTPERPLIATVWGVGYKLEE